MDMHFKAPRDPNMPSPMVALRTVAPEESIKCSVGGGECSRLAVEAHDDTEGGEFYVCAYHLPEFHAFSKLVAEMTPNQLNNLTEILKPHQI